MLEGLSWCCGKRDQCNLALVAKHEGPGKPETAMHLPQQVPKSEKDGFSSSEEEPEPTPKPDESERIRILAQQQRPRRPSISAPKIDNGQIRDYQKQIHPKDEEAKARLRSTLRGSGGSVEVLFGHVQGDALEDIINAFYSKEAPQGEDIIRQGDIGDRLYIIDEGSVDIFVARPGPDGAIAPGNRGLKVTTFGTGDLFGELALMYSAPRAATVTAASTAVKLWVLDEQDFKLLLQKNQQEQYTRYEGWLADVELLKPLNRFELSQVADALEGSHFEAGEEIITQGEAGDKFYILKDGEAAAFISGTDGEKLVKTYNTKGDYFGEISLLTSAPRKATVRAMGEGCSVMSLSRDDFTLMFGPVLADLENRLGEYTRDEEMLK